MTLLQLFKYLSSHPVLVLGYFISIPLLALVAGWLDKDQGHYLPWNYIYAFLIYLVSIPGIFAVTLSVYLFLFEKQSILSTDLLTQVLPVASMIISLSIIRKNVVLDYIPGFDRLSGLMLLITGIIAMMWLIDRFRIIGFVHLHFSYVVIFLLGMLILMRIGLRRLGGRY